MQPHQANRGTLLPEERENIENLALALEGNKHSPEELRAMDDFDLVSYLYKLEH